MSDGLLALCLREVVHFGVVEENAENSLLLAYRLKYRGMHVSFWLSWIRHFVWNSATSLIPIVPERCDENTQLGNR